MENTILSCLIFPLKEHSPQTGIYLNDESDEPSFVSYPDLYLRVQSAAGIFCDAGMAKGTRVILPFATSFDSIVAFLALVGIGAIPLSVKTPASGGNSTDYAEYLRLLISRFGASYIIDAPGLAPELLPVPQVSVPQELSGNDFVGWAMPAADEIAFIQFSSGTTSEPKGVVIKHGQLILQLNMIISHDGRSREDTGSSWLPLYHDMGLVGALLTPMYTGHTLHLCSPGRFLLDPVEWLCGLSAHGVTVSALPNFGLAYLLKRFKEPEAEIPEMRLDKLRRIYIGSDTIDPAVVHELSRELEQYGLSRNSFSPCYGMAEAVLMVTCKPQDKMMRVSRRMGGAVVSVGPVLRGFDLKLAGPDGDIAEAKEEGEILLRGGSLGDRYFEDERPMLDAEGFYHTGDIGFVEEGELFISGRIGDRIKINGQNYYLPHLENALQAHPGLRPGGVAVIQAAGALIVLAEPRNFRSGERLDSLRSELSDMLLSSTGVKVQAERICYVRRGQIKRTSSGKLQRNLLTKEFSDQKIKIFEVGLNA